MRPEWTHFEDQTLMGNQCEELSVTPDYQILVQSKGQEECQARIKFLQTAADALKVINSS